MLKRFIYTTLVGIFCFGTLTAQDHKMNFLQAYEAYEAGDYTGSIAKLDALEQSLGKTNPKIQSLKTLVYYETGDVNRALLELERYFRTSPDKTTSEYENMVALHKELQEASRAHFSSVRQKLEKQKEQELREADEAIKAEKDQFYYQVARQAGTIEAYELFLQKSSTPELDKVVKELLAEEKKNQEYETLLNEGFAHLAGGAPLQAIEKFTAASNMRASDWLTQQLNDAREYAADLAWNAGNKDLVAGRWVSAANHFKQVIAFRNSPEAARRLAQAQDEASYEAAVKSATAEGYHSYLKKYPDAIWKKAAEKFLLHHYLEAAAQSLASHQSVDVKANLEKARAFQSSEYWTVFKNEYYRLMLHEAVYLTSGPKKQRMEGILPAIAYYEELNAGSGTSYSSRLKMLKWKNKEWNRPGMGYFAFHSDATFDEVGLVFGVDKNRGLGFNISIRTAPQALAANEFKHNGMQHVKGIANLNLTKKIIYPLWIYAGGGYASFQSINPLASDPSKGALGDETVDTFNIETGVSLHLKPVYLAVGSSFPYLNAKQNAQLGFTKSPSYLNVAIGFGW